MENLQEPVFWVAVAFFALVILAWRPMAKFLSTSLDGRAQKISDELAQAVRLREEAQATLQAYQQKQQEIAAEAKTILDNALAESARMQEEASKQLEKAIETRLSLANERIAQEENKAIKEVQLQIIELATTAARTVLTSSMQEQANDNLLNAALADIGKIAG